MGERRATMIRTTEHAEVQVLLDLDGQGICITQTGAPFLDRMLSQLARSSGFDLQIQCTVGETKTEELAEDLGACLGLALERALGDQKGIERDGHAYAPADSSLVRAVVAFVGDPCFVYRMRSPAPAIVMADAGAVERFWRAFTLQARLNLHIELLYGSDGVAAFEALFKAAGRALRAACRLSHGTATARRS